MRVVGPVAVPTGARVWLASGHTDMRNYAEHTIMLKLGFEVVANSMHQLRRPPISPNRYDPVAKSRRVPLALPSRNHN